jgi:hypothetical protein
LKHECYGQDAGDYTIEFSATAKGLGSLVPIVYAVKVAAYQVENPIRTALESLHGLSQPVSSELGSELAALRCSLLQIQVIWCFIDPVECPH